MIKAVQNLNMINIMKVTNTSQRHHCHRVASPGSRPRLPLPLQNSYKSIAKFHIQPKIYDRIHKWIAKCQNFYHCAKDVFVSLKRAVEPLRLNAYKKVVKCGRTPTDDKHADYHRKTDSCFSFYFPFFCSYHRFSSKVIWRWWLKYKW